MKTNQEKLFATNNAGKGYSPYLIKDAKVNKCKNKNELKSNQ